MLNVVAKYGKVSGKVFENSLQIVVFDQVILGARDEVAVVFLGGHHRGMAEPPGDGEDGNAGRQAPGGEGVAEHVPVSGAAGGPGDAPKARVHGGSVRRPALVGKEQAVFCDLYPLLYSLPASLRHRDGAVSASLRGHFNP